MALEQQNARLDVGCGFNKQDGFIGMDKRSLPNVDIVHDVEVFPWPIPSGSCGVILMSHLVEHIKPWLTIDLMDEAWRVMASNGVLLVATPYARSYGYLQDPTHCNPWVEATVTYFVKGQPLYEIYKPKPWKAEKVTWNNHGNLEFVLRKIEE
jgi:predicted SAM-dependent methyltransferase